MKNVLFVGLDVDTKNFHVAIVSQQSGEMFGFKIKNDVPALIKKLKGYAKGAELRVCYEASYIGFSLHRTLKANGIHCDVIAPSAIPRKTGERVKTDRIDAEKLATYYMQNMLTPVYVPEVEVEADRDLIRSRHFLQLQIKDLKYHIAHFCRRIGLNYKECTDSKQYWTGEHMKWIKQKAGALKEPSQSATLTLLLKQLSQFQDLVEDFDSELQKIADKKRYRKQVAALGAFRGIARTFALQFITEIGDIKRFNHPKQLTSYAGMDIVEYSSGGRQNRFSITKTGNAFIRTAAVEACQRADKTPKETKHLKKRREELGSTKEHIEIADRCMRRLYKRSIRLTSRGKHTNKVKVACARELLGFVWEALRAAA